MKLSFACVGVWLVLVVPVGAQEEAVADPPAVDAAPEIPLVMQERASWLARIRADRPYYGQFVRAADRGLEWLRSRQGQDGAFEPEHSGRIGTTALAVWAFLAAGNQPDVGEHAACVSSGLGWLLRQQSPDDGWMGERGDDAGSLRQHALATCVLIDAALLTQRAQLVQRARLALEAMRRLETDDPWWDAARAYGEFLGVSPPRPAKEGLFAHYMRCIARRERPRPDPGRVKSALALVADDSAPTAERWLAVLGLYQRGDGPWNDALRDLFYWKQERRDDGAWNRHGVAEPSVDRTALCALAFYTPSLLRRTGPR